MIRGHPELIFTKNSYEQKLNKETIEMSAGDFVAKYQYLENDNPRVRSSKHWKQKEGGSLLRYYDLQKFEQDYNVELSKYKENI